LTVNENLEAAKTSHDLANSEAASAAAVDKEALAKAHADLASLTEEAEQLKQTHASASLEAQIKVTALEARLQETEDVASQLVALRAEKEETATKISEFEVEILELKEIQETLEDERLSLTNAIKALEGDLAQARSDLSKAAENLSAAEEQHIAAIDELQKKHADELGVSAEKQSEVASSLQAVQNDLQVTNSDLEKARNAAGEAEEAFKLKLSEVEQAYIAAQNELSEKIIAIAAELEVGILLWRGQVLTTCL
jgi:DNA repair exonuclease SbcCD ATPase subunit